MNCFSYTKRKCFIEDARHSVGSCLIVCAIPLLVPGVTITAVAFGDETGFSKFSAAHVFGMVLLALAILAFVVGVGLSVRTKSRITPDDFLQTVSTHRKCSVDATLDTTFTPKSSEHPLKVKEVPDISNPYISQFNYFFPKNHIRALDDQDEHQKEVKEISTSTKILASDSSSDESFDSDNCSSGSYSITEEAPEDRSPLAPTASQYGQVKQHQKSCLNSKPKNLQKPEYRNFRTAVVQSLNMTSNNFFHYSADDIAAELRQLYKNKIKYSSQSEKPSSTHLETKEIIKNDAVQDKGSVCKNLTSPVPKPTLDIQNSPVARPRLHGLSSEDVLTTPETPMSPDIVVVPLKTFPPQRTTSEEEYVINSNLSVFSLTNESKTKIKKIENNSTKNNNSSWNFQLNYHKHLTRSPYATRPYSFPLEDRLCGPAGARVLKAVLGQNHSFRANSGNLSLHGYACGCHDDV